MATRDATIVNFSSERRSRRSNEAHTAIYYQLDHIFEAQKLKSFVLGDSRGLILAGAGDTDVATTLAAYAPLLATYRGERRLEVLDKIGGLIDGFDPEAMSIRSFEIDGETLFLCSMGRETAARQASLYRAVTGIRRILKQTAVAA